MAENFCITTPNLNMGHHLAGTIESVLRNMHAGDEYFVIDGGSTDNSLEILKTYERSLTGWISERDNGYADAVAKGFSRSTSSLQCWVNSSDVLMEGALQKARQVFCETEAEFIFGDDLCVDSEMTVLAATTGRVSSLRNMMLFGGWTPLQDACFWRRTLYERVGGIDRNLRYAADFDLFLRFSLFGNYAYVPYTFSAFRIHDGQVSIKKAAEYKQEREVSRKRALRQAGIPAHSRILQGLYYWTAVRLRARVLAPLWSKRTLRSAGSRMLHDRL